MSDEEQQKEDIYAELTSMIKSNLPSLEEEAEDIVASVEPKEEPEAIAEPVYTEVEQKALAKNWDPKGKYDAETFLRFGEIIDEVKASHKVVKSLKLKIQEAERKGYEKALREAKEARRIAAEYGDLDKLDDFDDSIQEIRSKIHGLESIEDEDDDVEAPLPQEKYADLMKKETDAFLEKYKDIILSPNPKSQELFQYISTYDAQLVNLRKHPKEHFKELETVLLAKRAEMESAPPAEVKRQAVETGTILEADTKKDDKISLRDLSEVELVFYRYALDKGKPQAEAYLRDLAKERKRNG